MKRLISIFVSLLLLYTATAQQFSPDLFNAMQWRMIGPFRGGRTVGAVGVPQQPNVFYIGVNNGGVWKTTDYGRTWFPVFDDQPTGSIGDVAVAPSNPNILYVASGEGIQRPDLSVGDGVYKSADAGKTWVNTGLKDGQQIGGLAIDPNNENRVFAAVLGHPYGPNKERGLFRTTNGGNTWEKVLYIDENTGAVQVAIDPKNPSIVYADLWAGRQGPWENGRWSGSESGLYKSTDGGNTWKHLIEGLPTPQQGLGRIGFTIAPTNTNRLYATVDAGQFGGIYRSDDAGEHWKKMTSDERFWGRGDDFAEVKVDPTNEDIVYTADVVVWKSVDGANKWSAFRGAPGGDDYHRIWINPNNPDIILLAADQGAIITVNGGQTFSSWYNQPTAQFYHVSTDNAFPYNVYGGQQESGSVGIASRGNDGQISFREWHPVAVEEYGYVAADPKNPDIIYGGKITKYDKRTGQFQNIAPEAVRSGKYRFLRTAPVLFSPIDPSVLYFAGNVIFKTKDGGNSWQTISPDLTRESWDIPASVGVYTKEEMKKMPRRGVVYTIAPSFKDINTIWAGTDDGFIQVTKDGGKSWKNVTPPAITAWSKISMIEASHTNTKIAYAAVNRIRCDDMQPHIYKTMDGGISWKEIVTGLPNDPINTVKEDPLRPGLLFAGSERAVYVSFDDGEHWQSLRINMPATSIRDLVIKDDDLVVGTHGRGFWILDNITPLRQLSNNLAKAKAVLYKPQNTYRVRWNMNTDTPIPQEEPAGQNPPDGAMIDYYLQDAATTPVVLTISDAKGNVIRTFSSSDTLYTIPPVNIPLYWVRPQQLLSAGAGAHRFLWDMRYEPLNIPASYPIAAVFKNTSPVPTAPYVMPGVYTVKLTVNGVSFTQQFTIKMDPRVKTSIAQLQLQHDLSLQCYQSLKQSLEALKKIHSTQALLPVAGTEKEKQLLATLNDFEKHNGFAQSAAVCGTLFNILQESDMPPTSQTIVAAKEAIANFKILQAKWAAQKTFIDMAEK
ncbi:VPS10 domain-containing protein [Limnovirga soli]|uniref:Glycoside hydrolase n=1 Tax=Limnovirga soli TaxID=2656915 RepID=A0A8J8F9T1_9BACT|nr:glycoside hydrolase [Limnovirga soli]NNV54043.1 glycoside hydrolase [Limnovirga soli]